MTETTVDTMETILTSALDETEDRDIKFKLRTALQLLVVIGEQEKAARNALEDCTLDDELRRRLRDLGYLNT
jgi:hypothetical protein